MTDKVLCPWCGSKMMYKQLDHINGFCECPQCLAAGPAGRGEADARAAALRRYEPPCRPLTLEELIDSTDDPVYIESQKRKYLIGKFTAAVICHRIIWSDGTESNLDRYGKTWRCWPRKPTDEEREAAGWEDDMSADT